MSLVAFVIFWQRVGNGNVAKSKEEYSKNYDFVPFALPCLGIRYWLLPFCGQRYTTLLIVTTPLPYRSQPFPTVHHRYLSFDCFF